MHVSSCKIDGERLKLVSLSLINQALNANEQQAYKRLTRVLTHEVANSITPLASLAQTAVTLLPDDLTFTDSEDKDDLHLALTTLSTRSQHLSEFIKSFHQISALPAPNLQQIELSSLIKRVVSLFHGQAKDDSVNLLVKVQDSCLVMADAAQIEQVIINIVNNALFALKRRDIKTSTNK
ncbi:MAG: HAMP domain-containing histidine kinase [Psychrobium sp.]|nr:HAMP domain-containing histidine kinase [Psychrobium sp.]